jgi:hypothetical protein
LVALAEQAIMLYVPRDSGGFLRARRQPTISCGISEQAGVLGSW